MATRNIVPRENEEGNIGTNLKRWLKGWFKNLFVSGDITDGNSGISVTVSQLDNAVNKVHNQNTDTKLDEGGANELNILDIKDAVDKKHNSTLLGTKNIDESGIADGKSLVYNFASGNIEYITPPGGGDMLGSVYDINANDIVDKAETLNDGSSGGGNEVTALEARNHIDSVDDPHSVTKDQIGLGNVDNLQQIPLSQKGLANGVAELDSGSKVPTSQLPDTVVGAMEYKGVWDASGSYPSSPEKGDYWVVNVAGSPESGIEFEIGDWLVYNGASWDKIDNSCKVSSVAGKTGVVTLVEADITDMHTKNEDTQLDAGELEIDADNNVKIKETAYFDAEYDNGDSGAAKTINWKLGNKQKITLNDNCTFTFTNPSGACNLILKVIQDATGSRTVTFPASVKWAGGTAPTLSTGINDIDIVALYFDGTNYYCMASLDFS